jgi:RNA polymerase sigma factor (sigma-70 family)
LTSTSFPDRSRDDLLGWLFRVAELFDHDDKTTRDRARATPSVGMSPHDNTRFVRFFEANQASVFRAALGVCGNREAADDATAEAFARAYKHWAQLTTHPNPLGWVVRTAINVAISAWRAGNRTIPLSADTEVAVPPVTDQELLDTLARHLDDRERRVIVMYELVGMTTLQIADELRESPAVVRMLRRRALGKLRQVLGQEDEEASR